MLHRLRARRTMNSDRRVENFLFIYFWNAFPLISWSTHLSAWLSGYFKGGLESSPLLRGQDGAWSFGTLVLLAFITTFSSTGASTAIFILTFHWARKADNNSVYLWDEVCKQKEKKKNWTNETMFSCPSLLDAQDQLGLFETIQNVKVGIFKQCSLVT